jgi:hypothetical protein
MKTQMTVPEYVAHTGASERAIRNWLRRGLPVTGSKPSGRVGRPSVLIDVEQADNWRVLYTAPSTLKMMVNQQNRKE